MKIRSDSTEYVYASVTADHDLTGSTVEVALPAKDTTPVTWIPAATVSVTQTSTAPNAWTLTYRLLLGPDGGDIELAVGVYDWTFRLADTPETLVRKSGTVTVTAI